MSTVSNAEQLFHRIHLFITEGQADMALATLAQVPAGGACRECEVAYVRAWCATMRGDWDTAATFLLPISRVRHEGNGLLAIGQTERRRRIYYLLLLGQMANKLGYHEEATRHFTQCIKFLDERRMNILDVRIQARCGLGYAYTQIGFYAVALAHYENALHLSKTEEAHADMVEIYTGLCTAYRYVGDIEQALAYGEKALQLCRERTDPSLEGQAHTLLGQAHAQAHDFTEAISHYTEALELAQRSKRSALILTNLTALATVHLEAGSLEEAQRLYKQGIACLARTPGNPHLAGALYIVGGRIAEAAQVADKHEHARMLIDEAIACYRQAEAVLVPIQAKTELAEVYGHLAQILEASGRQNEALACWKSAYALHARPEESPVA